MIYLTAVQRPLVFYALRRALEDLSQIKQHLQSAAGVVGMNPSAVRSCWVAVETALADVASPDAIPISLDSKHAPILKITVMRERLSLARQLDRQRENVVSSELVQLFEGELEPFDTLIRGDWFEATTLHPFPELSDYLTPERVQSLSVLKARREREYEPKARILLAEPLLVHDLAFERSECASRNLPLSLVFVDIDNFKALNSALGEPTVDRDVLPLIMREVERAVFGRGSAYRHGGDEFVLLLPNCERDLARHVIRRLREGLRSLELRGVNAPVTCSAGCVEVMPGSVLTEREFVDRAAEAKRVAKSRRNCAAFCDGAPHSQPVIDEDAG